MLADLVEEEMANSLPDIQPRNPLWIIYTSAIGARKWTAIHSASFGADSGLRSVVNRVSIRMLDSIAFIAAVL
jgi:hypothetical protein